MTDRLPPHAVPQAAALLRAGRLVAFPTETVYGLGADATQPAAVAAIFAAKGRPPNNPLICHYPSATTAFDDTIATAQARALADQFWPGPLTLVLRRAAACGVAAAAAAGLPTLAVRVPAHPLALALLAAVARPVAAPSANRSGRISPTIAAHVLEELDARIDAVLDGGACAVGLESTVLDLTGPRPVLLRPGGVPAEAIAALIGPLNTPPPLGRGAALRSPGLLASHYAPTLPLRLNATTVAPHQALLAFGPPLPGAGLTVQLSATADPTEAAAHLFAAIRRLDHEAVARGLTEIAAMPIPDTGLGRAINDRLARAAAPRPIRRIDPVCRTNDTRTSMPQPISTAPSPSAQG